MSWMQQANRRLLHLINLSGHSQTGYFAPLKMNAMRIEVEGRFKSARTVREPRQLAVQSHDGYTVLTVPELSDYELVVLE